MPSPPQALLARRPRSDPSVVFISHAFVFFCFCFRRDGRFFQNKQSDDLICPSGRWDFRRIFRSFHAVAERIKHFVVVPWPFYSQPRISVTLSTAVEYRVRHRRYVVTEITIARYRTLSKSRLHPFHRETPMAIMLVDELCKYTKICVHFLTI